MLVHSFIHSGHFYSAPSSSLLLIGAPDYSTDTVSEFHAEAHRQLQIKDLPKAARVGVEPTTLRLKVIVSTKAIPHPTHSYVICFVYLVLTMKFQCISLIPVHSSTHLNSSMLWELCNNPQVRAG